MMFMAKYAQNQAHLIHSLRAAGIEASLSPASFNPGKSQQGAIIQKTRLPREFPLRTSTTLGSCLQKGCLKM